MRVVEVRMVNRTRFQALFTAILIPLCAASTLSAIVEPSAIAKRAMGIAWQGVETGCQDFSEVFSSAQFGAMKAQMSGHNVEPPTPLQVLKVTAPRFPLKFAGQLAKDSLLQGARRALKLGSNGSYLAKTAIGTGIGCAMGAAQRVPLKSIVANAIPKLCIGLAANFVHNAVVRATGIREPAWLSGFTKKHWILFSLASCLLPIPLSPAKLSEWLWGMAFGKLMERGQK